MVALQTFKNLPAERQTAIILASLEEFALHDYETASLSNIISKLGLAKGSFYRYFENKQTLYHFLLDHCIEARIKNDEAYTGKLSSDLFDSIIQHFIARVRFDEHSPLQSAFLHNVMQEKSNDDLGNIALLSKLKVIAIIKQLIAVQTEMGNLRTDVAADALAFMVFQVQSLITDYITVMYKVDIRESIRSKKSIYSIPEAELMDICRQFTEILRNGISR